MPFIGHDLMTVYESLALQVPGSWADWVFVSPLEDVRRIETGWSR
jgi:hypothetical protein